MGLKEIVAIRQYTWFTPAGKMVKMYEVKFTTDKTEGEFTFDVTLADYNKEMAIQTARDRAKDIDEAIG